MKTNKKNLKNQRILLDRKVAPWLKVREDRSPPSGWLKAARGALGMSTRQLAIRLGVEHSAILQFEKNEAAGKVSFESIQKVAKAMRCRFVYAVVPEEPFASFDDLLEDQALLAARATTEKVDHTMRLERQGVNAALSVAHAKEIAHELKENLDSTIWSDSQTILGRKKDK